MRLPAAEGSLKMLANFTLVAMKKSQGIFYEKSKSLWFSRARNTVHVEDSIGRRPRATQTIALKIFHFYTVTFYLACLVSEEHCVYYLALAS